MKVVNQEVSRQPRRNLRTMVAIGLVSLLAFTAGCSGQPSSSPNNRSNATLALKPTPTPDIGVDEMVNRALSEVRQEFDTKRTVSALIGMCIGWPEQDRGKITVVLNPGLKTYKNGQEELLMNVFTRLDQSADSMQISDMALMNGALAYSDSLGRGFSNFENDAIVVVSGKFSGGAKQFDLERSVSEEPSRGPDGRWAFTDAESGLPLLKTDVVDGPLTFSHLSQVCEEMAVGPKS